MRENIQQSVTFLYVKDLGISAEFYAHTLNLPLVLEQTNCNIYRLTKTSFLGICENPEKADPNGIIITLVSDQLEEWQSFLETKGLSLEKPITYNPTYNITHLFLRDPDGYLIEIQTFHDPAWPQTD